MRVAGELDLVTSPILDRHLAAAVARGRAQVVVDLSAVTFVDVRGVNSLVAARRAAREAGSVLVLQAPSRPVQRVIEVFGLDHLTG